MSLQHYQHVQDFLSIWSQANVTLDAVSYLSCYRSKGHSTRCLRNGLWRPWGYATL